MRLLPAAMAAHGPSGHREPNWGILGHLEIIPTPSRQGLSKINRHPCRRLILPL